MDQTYAEEVNAVDFTNAVEEVTKQKPNMMQIRLACICVFEIPLFLMIWFCIATLSILMLSTRRQTLSQQLCGLMLKILALLNKLRRQKGNCSVCE